jgi:sugar phosphate isomerase/epimerase
MQTRSGVRRSFLKNLLLAPALLPTTLLFGGIGSEKNFTSPLKLSLNAFSFNDALLAKQMSTDQLLQYCYDEGIGAVDITAYYIPGYPIVPADDVLFQFKRKAFQLGVDISGTGVRNDFTEPDSTKRKEQVQLVKNWIVAAAKIGAPVIRIFAGNRNPIGKDREDMHQRVLTSIQECVEFGKEHGVVVALQNHNDFIQTADEALDFIRQINSSWFGLVLDTGSYRVGDPYAEIAKTAMHAVNWQIKENVFIKGQETEADINRIIKIIIDSGYKGYIPIETLGKGDPKVKVAALLTKVKNAITRY